ncbi:nucleophosmin 1a [Triplophysa dalaica]|uniref:nucleophosmin 1a n=1 Tax=Triplophysa dalaica TaxID=1582913 RepID=UPI0024DFEA57|nr:nucleophosmin 1a [Triplophysa dalaica]
MDLEQMGPQTFLYGCELKAGKEITFNPEDDDYDHQLSIRMACLDPKTKDELNVVEIEGQDVEGQKVKAVLATLKPSTLPSVCLGGFEITPPVVFRLRAGSGPVHISGQHLVIMGGDQSFDEDEDDDEEVEEEEEVKTSKKRPASLAQKPSKKMKVDEEEEEEDDDEDDEEDDEDEESEEESPVKQKKPAAKPQTPAQNGKGPKPSTPAAKQNKTPVKNNKGDKGQSPKTPQTPRVPLTIQEIKAKMLTTVEKGGSLPKVQAKFENFVKNCFKENDQKVIDDLWKWRQAQN